MNKKFLTLHKIRPKQYALFMFIMISTIVLILFALPSNQPAKINALPDPTGTKVEMIMQMYNCENHEIYQAIMNTFDPVLVATVIAIESEFKVNAISPVGARGLMQLTPDKLNDWKNVTKNIEIGSAYLKEQLDRFGDLDLAMAAYNAGPNSVTKYQGIPPYKETIQYIKKAKSFSLILEKMLSSKDSSNTDMLVDKV